MYCQSCGARVGDGDKFCSVCGAPVARPVDVNNSPEQSAVQSGNYTSAANAVQNADNEAGSKAKQAGREDAKWLMIWGIASIATCETGVVGMVLAIIAAVKRKHYYENGGIKCAKATIGKITSLVALPISIISTIFWCVGIVYEILIISLESAFSNVFYQIFYDIFGDFFDELFGELFDEIFGSFLMTVSNLI